MVLLAAARVDTGSNPVTRSKCFNAEKMSWRTRRSHKPPQVGSIPTSATKFAGIAYVVIALV
jgi:hypothetical protein